MRSNKGITLISLISSLLLLLILAATTIATSMNAYNQMKFEGEKAELEEVQKLVDEIAADYQTYLNEQGIAKEYIDYFRDRYNATDFSDKLLSNHLTDVKTLSDKYVVIQNSISNSSKTAFYFTTDDLVKYFNLKGIGSVVVDFSTRSVYSVEGIKDSDDKTKIYYTPSDWGANSVIQSANSENTAISIAISQYSQNKDGSQIDVKLQITPKLSTTVTEVYYYKDGKYVKIDYFREMTNASATEIRVTVPNGCASKFKVVDELKNSYESN